MAYFPNKNDTDQLARMNSLGPTEQAQTSVQQGQEDVQQNVQQQGGQQSYDSPEQANAPTTTSGGGSSKRGSGMGSDIRKYISQNQASGIAQGVNKSTEQQAQSVANQINKQQSSFLDKVNQQRQMQESAFQKAQGIASQAGQLGADQSLSQEQISQYQNAVNMQSPQMNFDTTRVQQDVNRLGNVAQQASRGNRADILRNTFGRQGRSYTQGQSTLDEVLLGSNRQAGESIANRATELAQQQQEALRGATQQATQSLGEVSAQRQQGIQGLQEQTQQGYQGLREELQNRLAQTPDLREAFASGQITQDVLDTLGLEDNKLYGVDPTAYLKQVGISELASADELARANALAQLQGREQDIITNTGAVGAEDPYGLEVLKSRIAERRGEYEQGLSDYEAQQQDIANLKNFFNQQGEMLLGRIKNTASGNQLKSLLSKAGVDWNDLKRNVKRSGLFSSAENIGKYLDQTAGRRQANILSQLQSTYNPDEALAVNANNGAVKQSKASLLRKLLK